MRSCWFSLRWWMVPGGGATVCAAAGSIKPATTAVNIKALACIFIMVSPCSLGVRLARHPGHFFEHGVLENVAEKVGNHSPARGCRWLLKSVHRGVPLTGRAQDGN